MTSANFQLVLLVTVLAVGGALRLVAAGFRPGSAAHSFLGYMVLAFLGGVMWLLYQDDAFRIDPYESIIREQFHLPADVALRRVASVPKTPVCWLDDVFYSTQVKFSKAQFERYARSLDDTTKWHSINRLHLGENTSFEIPAGSLAWQSLPEPPSLGSQIAVWRVAGEDVRHGKALCFDLRPTLRNRAGGMNYAVSGCNARGRHQSVPKRGAHIEAALDSDTLTLNLYMRYRSKAAYCNNRSARAFDELLLGGSH